MDGIGGAVGVHAIMTDTSCTVMITKHKMFIILFLAIISSVSSVTSTTKKSPHRNFALAIQNFDIKTVTSILDIGTITVDTASRDIVDELQNTNQTVSTEKNTMENEYQSNLNKVMKELENTIIEKEQITCDMNQAVLTFVWSSIINYF